MSLLEIARLGHPQIRSVAKPVREEELRTADVQRLIDDMVETMRQAKGVGIAAPQVQVSRRIIAIEVSPKNPRYPGNTGVPLTIVVNPSLVEHRKETLEDWEGCLSVPDLRGVVPRYEWVRVTGVDREGRPVQYEADGFFARVFQHEIDHLNGKVFLDRLLDLQTLTHLREYEQYWGGTKLG